MNEKELPVVVWDMRVEFYKGDEPLEEWVQPTAMFADEATRRRGSSGPVNLPPRVAFMRTIVLIASRENKRRELAAANRAVFVADTSGTRDKIEERTLPW